VKTTSLFVELVVVGIGGAIWIVLLVLSFFGWSWIPTDLHISIAALIPALSLIYLIGTISDRVADGIIDCAWRSRSIKKWFGSYEIYTNNRLRALENIKSLATPLEYIRSRLRVCRGWALNSLLISVIFPIFYELKLDEIVKDAFILWFVFIAFILIFLGCCYSIWKLCTAEFRNIARCINYLDSTIQDDKK
jgi:hypothetical protein